ncbi:hypothetical protein [Streptomyces sp. MBT42]|nr:hypothetical protein [Streptomyces sp. MBT42]
MVWSSRLELGWTASPEPKSATIPARMVQSAKTWPPTCTDIV